MKEAQLSFFKKNFWPIIVRLNKQNLVLYHVYYQWKVANPHWQISSFASSAFSRQGNHAFSRGNLHKQVTDNVRTISTSDKLNHFLGGSCTFSTGGGGRGWVGDGEAGEIEHGLLRRPLINL